MTATALIAAAERIFLSILDCLHRPLTGVQNNLAGSTFPGRHKNFREVWPDYKDADAAEVSTRPGHRPRAYEADCVNRWRAPEVTKVARQAVRSIRRSLSD